MSRTACSATADGRRAEGLRYLRASLVAGATGSRAHELGLHAEHAAAQRPRQIGGSAACSPSRPTRLRAPRADTKECAVCVEGGQAGGQMSGLLRFY
jgi:hypothetical protein